MEFRILGPVEVWGDDGLIALGGPQQRRLAAVLLTEQGRALSAQRLVEVLWPDGEAPDGARRAVMTYVSRLRTALGDGVVVTRDEGYALDIDSTAVDANRFEHLVTDARAASPQRARELLTQALALWRGPAPCGRASANRHNSESHDNDERRADDLRVDLHVGPLSSRLPAAIATRSPTVRKAIYKASTAAG